MPRTVESIVACHVAARELREAGRPIWALTLPLKRIWAPYQGNEDDALTSEQARELARAIAVVVNAKVPKAWRHHDHPNFSYDFEDLMERFEQAEAHDFEPTVEFSEPPVEVLGSWVDELYDWADRCRVWIN